MKLAKKMVLMAAALPLVLGSASVMAFGGKGHHKGGHEFGGKCGVGLDKRVMRKLDLTDEQKAQLKQMREDARSNMKGKSSEMFAQKQAHQQQVQQLLLADTFDENAAQVLATQMVEAQTEKRVKMLEQQHKAMSILTAEQKTKLQELQQERAEKCAEKFAERQQDS
ncbi:periplasmic repressor CpxP [Vibrio nigripulchritudo]|uniref:CpxP family protein n=1 Tax=Vibrio nigripulchritudo TaxID=28173 RepID=UPI00190CCD42|nr:CpxP family protein [Vibrio nigripulchritudo]BCL68295.1 periplasmic repressor CpxP [Vibrio nigripulchritudo]BDU29623.1 periplasmic repressor CpxP [Vibrio nigripulchritudo]